MSQGLPWKPSAARCLARAMILGAWGRDTMVMRIPGHPSRPTIGARVPPRCSRRRGRTVAPDRLAHSARNGRRPDDGSGDHGTDCARRGPSCDASLRHGRVPAILSNPGTDAARGGRVRNRSREEKTESRHRVTPEAGPFEVRVFRPAAFGRGSPFRVPAPAKPS